MNAAAGGSTAVIALALFAACGGHSKSTGEDAEAGASGTAVSGNGGAGGASAGSGGPSAGQGGMSGSAGNGGSSASGGTAGTGAAGGGRGGSGGASGGAPLGGRAGQGGNGGRGAAAGAGAGGAASGRGGGGATGTGGIGIGGATGGPKCGNGMLDINEGCDDGAKMSGDGCSSTCVIEKGFGCDGSTPTLCKRLWPSCVFLKGDECQGGDCCAGSLVEGGEFTQGQGTASTFSSTVSSFLLDDYEVTVGRFRAFVSSYDGWRAENPQAGAGANPKIAMSGWKTSWNDSLPATSASLATSLECDATYQTWSDSGGDTLPLNCLNWYTAFAFCIWDEGRLPTEAEWEYAAAGGPNNYAYPWGEAPVPTGAQDSTADYANYACLGDGSAPGACAFTDLLPVGSKAKGKGFYGQSDLAGSLLEWTLDDYGAYPTAAQTDYARVVDGADRAIRGGNWYLDATTLPATSRSSTSAGTSAGHIGLRCARTPP